MDNWYVHQAVETRKRADQIAQAEHYQLVKLAKAAHPGKGNFYAQAALRLGAWMVTWGSWLQTRYAPAPELRSASAAKTG